MATSLETMQQKQLDTWLEQRLDELLPRKLKEIEEAKTPSMAIVVTKGTLDWAYPRSFWLPLPPHWVGMYLHFYFLWSAAIEEKSQCTG